MRQDLERVPGAKIVLPVHPIDCPNPDTPSVGTIGAVSGAAGLQNELTVSAYPNVTKESPAADADTTEDAMQNQTNGGSETAQGTDSDIKDGNASSPLPHKDQGSKAKGESKKKSARRAILAASLVLILFLVVVLITKNSKGSGNAAVSAEETATAASAEETAIATAALLDEKKPENEATAKPTIATAEETKAPVVMKTVDWTTEKPPENAENVLEKTQYSYRDKETMTSTESSVSGWTLEKSEDVWGDWSSWSTTSVTQSATVDVESKKQYRLYYFVCSKCGYHMPLYGTKQACWKCGELGLKTTEGKRTKWIDTPYNQLPYKSTKNSTKKQVIYDGELWYFGTSDLNASESKYIRTVYRSRTLEKKYHYWKWSDWSSWSDTRNSGHDDTRTRTLWKYQAPET
jgi:rubrerythrin